MSKYLKAPEPNREQKRKSARYFLFTFLLVYVESGIFRLLARDSQHPLVLWCEYLVLGLTIVACFFFLSYWMKDRFETISRVLFLCTAFGVVMVLACATLSLVLPLFSAAGGAQ